MVRIEPLMVKTVEGDEDLELEADSGESFLVTDIQVYNPLSEYMTTKVAKATVGYHRIGGTLGNHLAVPGTDMVHKTLLNLLFELGLWRGFPIAEGEKLTLDGVAQAAAVQKVFYEIYEGGDITPDMPNGSKALEYDFLNYGRVTTVVDGDNLFDVQKSPDEFPDFPFEGDVPSGKTIEVLGILFSDIHKADTGQVNQEVTKFLKFVQERLTHWDEDLQGYPVIGLARAADATDVGMGISDFGNYNDVDARLPLILKQPQRYVSGEELNAYLTLEELAGAENIVAGDVEMALIERVAPA